MVIAISKRHVDPTFPLDVYNQLVEENELGFAVTV